MAILLLAFVAVAFAAEWRVIYPNIGTIDLGISFIDPRVGYTVVVSNGLGPQILKTINAGITWTPCNVTNWGAALLLFDVDAVGETAVVSTISGQLYSNNDGQSFQLSVGGGLSQTVRHIGQDGAGGRLFGIAGAFPLRDTKGVGISTNGGITFSIYDANVYTEPRYAAFPADDVWYVSAGTFPSSDPIIHGKHSPLAWRSRIFDNDGKVTWRPTAYSGKETARKATAGGYTAQISKTSNGGLNWVTQFAENGTFYFNGIDCSPNNVNECCAVGEGYSPESAEPGSRILCTTDGGNTWTRTFWQPENPDFADGLMQIRYSSATEIWAVGVHISWTQFPLFVHSTDGGNTWEKIILEDMIGSIAFSLSFPTSTTGYATVVSAITQSSAILKYGA